MRIKLELFSPGDLPVDLGMIRPSKILSLTPGEIEKLPVLVAGCSYELGEHFKVTKFEDSVDEVLLLGATRRIVSAGRGMDEGRLAIHGEAGPFTGAEMSGGELEVFGEAGDCVGVAMHGGMLRVHGNAGDWCGAAQPGQAKGMNGGTLIVDGNVGAETGTGMLRGLLIIGGDSGEATGAGLLAGTIFCLGRMGAGAGLEMKRGSLVADSSRALPAGFRPAGEADPEWVQMFLVSGRKHGLCYPPSWEQRPPQRFTGDHLVLGKGEVLVYDILE